MWCLACNSKNLSKKRIVTMALIVGAIGGVLYYSSTINSALTVAVLPIILPFLGCIIMCGVMAGWMFLSGRLSKKSEAHHSCCANQPEQAIAKVESTEDKKSSSP